MAENYFHKNVPIFSKIYNALLLTNLRKTICMSEIPIVGKIDFYMQVKIQDPTWELRQVPIWVPIQGLEVALKMMFTYDEHFQVFKLEQFIYLFNTLLPDNPSELAERQLYAVA